MNAQLRKIWLDLKGSYWFIPSVLTLLAILLSVLTVWADRQGAAEWLFGTGWVATSSPDGARNQLGVIASAMISIASTVFAITIAAVAYASGNYGPRLLTNFMNDRGNQVSLGVFIATFVYALLILRVIRAEDTEIDQFIPQVSVFAATVLVLFAVAVLVYFLHHVPASIRINSVLAGIGRRLIEDLEKRFPDRFTGSEPGGSPPGMPIRAQSCGYVEVIDFAQLQDAAEKHDLTVSLSVRTGDFVHLGIPLVEIAGRRTDEVEEAIRSAFALGASRTQSQDLEYLIDELVEIALRALSPGINDPFTAVSSLHWLGAAMTLLAGRDLRRGPEQEDYDPSCVYPVSDDFHHFLRRSFGAVRASVAASPMAAVVCLQVMVPILRAAPSPERRLIVAKEAEALLGQAECALAGPALDGVREQYQTFMKEA